jgi:hypothetical protein
VTARAHRELRHFNLSSGFREESTMGTVVDHVRLSDGSTSILPRRTGSASALT